MKSLVDVVAKKLPQADLRKNLDQLGEKVRKEADSVAWSLFQIVSGSAETAWAFVSAHAEQVTKVILKDLAGGLTAVVGALPEQRDPKVLFGIALAGAISSSIDAYYEK